MHEAIEQYLRKRGINFVGKDGPRRNRENAGPAPCCERIAAERNNCFLRWQGRSPAQPRECRPGALL